MAEVADWNPVDDDNNTAPPVGAPEGMVPSAVNNTMRAMMGSLKRQHDSLVASTLVLPYLPLVGGVVTGSVTINGTAGLSLQTTQLRNASSGLEVFNPSSGYVGSRGPGAGFLFGDRDQTSPNWLWSANGGLARLGNGADRLTVSAAGNLGVTGDVNAIGYRINGVGFADNTPGTTSIYDPTGTAAVQLFANQTYYNANSHTFRNDAFATTAGIDASGNFVATGSVSGASIGTGGTITGNAISCNNIAINSTVTAGYVTSTGDVHANNAVTAPSITASGTVQGGYIHSTGTVDGTQLTSSGNINASGSISAATSLVASGTVFGAAANISGTCTAANLSASANANIAGTLTAGALTTGSNANIAGTCTAANFVGAFAAPPGSTISAPGGTITTANLSASSNVTASGTVTGNSMVCGNGVFQNTGPSNLIGQTSFGPSGSWARIDAVASYNVTGAWQTFSDRAVKEAITPYTAGLDAINQLEPVSYTYTSEIEQTPVTRYGLVAQDVAPIVPEMVGEGVTPGGTTMATLNGGHATWLLINAVKELSAKVALLEAQLAAA